MNNYLKKKIIVNAICWPFMIATVVGIQIGNTFADLYSANITGILCPSVINAAESGEAISKGNELAIQIEQEGAVLVQNKNNVLPLASSNKTINLFGRGSVDWHYGGQGSGVVYINGGRDVCDLTGALKEYGCTVNDNLINATLKFHAAVPDMGTLGNVTTKCCTFYEPKISEYQSVYDAAKSVTDTAIVAFGRYGGESNDLAHTQPKDKYPTDETRTYLDLSTEEEELLLQVSKDYDKVILIINSTNPVNLGCLDDPEFEGVDACLVVGPTGCVGARAIPQILYGETNPSGHLTDTYVYDFETSPSYWVTGFENLGIYEGSRSGNISENSNVSGGNNGTTGSTDGGFAHGEDAAVYTDYVEGIYVGYRWYETADAEHYWETTKWGSYDNVVQYPFGFGMSYTTFDWEIDNANLSLPNGSSITNETKLTIPVKVTNTGATAGKDVVQVYLNAPYTSGEIEKSSIQLVGYAKTPLLQPNATATINIQVDANDFKSFDEYDKNHNDFKGYELEAGDYVLSLRTDVHNIKDNDASKFSLTYKADNDIKIEEDEVTGNPVKPLLSGENAIDGFSIDGNDSDQNINYFSRANFPALFTSRPAYRNWNASRMETSPGQTHFNAYSPTLASAWDNYGSTHNGKDPFGNDIPTTKPTYGKARVTLVENFELTENGRKCAADYNDPLWQDVLDSTTYSDAKLIAYENYAYSRPAMEYIGLNQSLSDKDGPAQVNPKLDGGSTTTGYPSPTVTGQSWNDRLAFNMGKSYAGDMKAVGVDGAYGFACNTHRTPFNGRNFEYFSEDPILSGRMASESCRGVQVAGRTTYLKHFCCNDQEQWRCGMYTWLTEQAFREIYAKPFEIAIKNDATTAIMTAFNRIGATWSGGNEAAIQGIMRNEWGFHGVVKTDYGEDHKFMDPAQAVRAGGTMMLGYSYSQGSCTFPSESSATPRFAHRLREGVHETIYTYIHALYLNEEYNKNPDDGESAIISVPSKESWVWWKPALYTIEAFVYGGIVIGAYFLLRPKEVEENSEPSTESEGK